jgi:uncharacterized protein YkwD
MRIGLQALCWAAVIAVSADFPQISADAKPTTTAERAARLQSALEELAFDYSNKERLRHGLEKFARSRALKFVARRHSEHMCVMRAFEHESSVFPPGWRTLESRLRRVSVSQGGENIGYLTVSRDSEAWARRMVSSWMKSPTHRNNLLEAGFCYMDVGVHLCDDELVYITQVFGTEEGRAP